MSSTCRELLLNQFSPTDREDQHLNRLVTLVDQLIHSRTLGETLDHFVGIQEWTRVSDISLPLPVRSVSQMPEASDKLFRRFGVFVLVLENSRELCDQFRHQISVILEGTRAIHLFAETGLPSDRGLFAEASERLLRRTLPTPRDNEDLSKVVSRLFPTSKEAERFGLVPSELTERFVKVISGDQPAEFWNPLQDALYEALCLLAARVQALGLSEKIRARSPYRPVRQSPFFRLSRTVDAILLSLENQEDFGPLLSLWQTTLADCRKELEAINQMLETAGVNLDLVYSVDVLHQSLDRMEAIVQVLSQPSGLTKIQAVRNLLSQVIKGRLADRSLMDLGSNGLRLLATKIVEQAGKTGEHYITVTRKEYSAMWKAGLGGGVLTGVTAALKLPITHSGFPPFLEGMLGGINYAFSFILIQSFHFVLATKQPSMTAAAFAGIIKKHQGVSRLNELVTYIARICRSQLAAAMANVTAVTVVCTLFALLWQTGKGTPYLSTEEADHLFHSLSPFVSGTIFYAALTGVILWFSSIVGGWIDNWAIYRQLPQALAEHPLGMVWGKERLEKAARILAPNVAAWGGSIALGFMMGMTPPLGRFFGIPLDVRHVTLTTGTWALAAASLGRGWYAKGWFLEALLGIGVIFVLNLTVSFTIALLVALRAYDIPAKEHLQLLKQVFQRLLRTPREFLLPPKRSTNARTSSH